MSNKRAKEKKNKNQSTQMHQKAPYKPAKSYQQTWFITAQLPPNTINSTIIYYITVLFTHIKN